MLTEFSKDKTRKPYVTIVVVLIAVIVTSINIVSNQFDDFLEKQTFLRMFILPFHHGFDFTSSIFHLIFSVGFFWYLSRNIEKVLGTKYFILLFLSAYISTILLQFLFSLRGYGLTPIIFTMSVYVFALMSEAKMIKTNVTHEPFYSRYISMSIAFMLSSLLLFTFLPVYYDIKSTTLLKGVFDGNFLHVMMTILGLITLIFTKRTIRMSWLRFNKRKSFHPKSKNKKTRLVTS